ncbi:MAG: hypothetical protein ACUVSX_12500 [Aggregatilineales bacterium]
MPRLTTLWQTVSAVVELSEIARSRQTYYFSTLGPITFFLKAEQAEVRVRRWAQPRVEVTVTLQAAFGWRVATDQDEAGVYVVAKRRPLVGSLARAAFDVLVPHDAYLDLRLDGGRVVLEGVRGALQVPPPSAEGALLRTDGPE